MAKVSITALGNCAHPSPLHHCIPDDTLIPAEIEWRDGRPPGETQLFEKAGPRKNLFFDPANTRAAIVTCGGLCPGLNHVIRSLFLQLHHGYRVKDVVGIRNGYRGLDPGLSGEPVRLTPDFVEDIHKEGGTALNTSRGPVDTARAVDNLMCRGIQMLFTIGGDGTQRGARELFLEAQRRGYPLSVVGIPKTIDNDVPFVSRTFGYLTAVQQARTIIDRAHREAHSVENGIAIVKLMGRHAGFIATGATIASQDVNFCLIPEVPFALEGPNGLLEALKRRILGRSHAVIVVAEGAGQELVADASNETRDESGNLKLGDIGPWLRHRIESYFKAEKIPVVLRYMDPSYFIRSCAADAEDAILCDLFARHAAHAAMAGKTGLIIGLLHNRFVHVPIELLTSQKKRVNPDGPEWQAVLASTGQPLCFA